MAGSKRRKIAPRPAARLSAAAIEAWRKGDYWRLHDELGLQIWVMPDWGYDPPMDEPPEWPAAIAEYEYVCAMQDQLRAVAGPGPRRWFFRSCRDGRAKAS
jgi:hypothetical protein